MQTNQIRRICAALCALILVLAPCLAGATDTTKHTLTSLNVAVVAAADENLSPLTCRERDMQSMLALCYEGLVALDDAEHPVPCLAEWDVPSENSKRWIFRLRPGITFQNGKPLTSADVIATLDRILALGQYDEDRHSELPREQRGVYSNIMEAYIAVSKSGASWKAIDELTVQITAGRPYYGFLNAMTFPILPADEVDKPLPSGTGPYAISQYEPGDRLWLSTWQGWRKTTPNVQNIIALIYPNTEQALAAFDAGQCNVAMTRSLTATRYSGSMRSFSIPYSTRQLEMLLMHHTQKSGILKDETVRRAIISAIDRSTLIRTIYQGMATATTTPIEPGTWLYDESATQEDYKPELARAMLDKAEWKLNEKGIRQKNIDGTPTELYLELLVYEELSGSVRQGAATAISDMLKLVGIECKVVPLDYDKVKVRLEAGSYDMALCAVNLDVVPDPGFMLLGIDTNYTRYRSETMNDLIKNMRTQTSEIGYKQAIAEIQHQFVSDAPFMCLYFRNGALLTRETFTDVSAMRELELLRGVEAW